MLAVLSCPAWSHPHKGRVHHQHKYKAAHPAKKIARHTNRKPLEKPVVISPPRISESRYVKVVAREVFLASYWGKVPNPTLKNWIHELHVAYQVTDDDLSNFSRWARHSNLNYKYELDQKVRTEYKRIQPLDWQSVQEIPSENTSIFKRFPAIN